MENKYWDIGKILPYQRKFNFINGPREIGKTYTTLKWLIKQALEKDQTFIYLCRTQKEKQSGVMEYALSKVIAEQYPEHEYSGNNFTGYLGKQQISNCIALSEYMQVKKLSFPTAKYFIFDEYMLEPEDSGAYVQGWREPDLLLNIYHTVDRGRDTLTGFLLGNNTNFYNPYHIHDAFNIPFTSPGTIWKNKNVLYQWATPSKQLLKELSQTSINKMIEGTKYGEYAVHGKYLNENSVFIDTLDKTYKYHFTVLYMDFQFGIYMSNEKGLCLVTDKVDTSCPFIYALTLPDHKENTLLLSRDLTHIKWLSWLFKKGLVRFSTIKIKQIFNDVVKIIMKY